MFVRSIMVLGCCYSCFWWLVLALACCLCLGVGLVHCRFRFLILIVGDLLVGLGTLA